MNEYEDEFLDNLAWSDLTPLPWEALTLAGREFATQVYRVFCSGAGFDCGAEIDFTKVDLLKDMPALVFVLQVWAAFTYPADAAFKANWIKNLAAMHAAIAGESSARSLIRPFTDIEDIYEARRLYFIAYATEAVTDLWDGTPLTPEQVKRIANAAMEYATFATD
jgi:hypothetical protein